MKYLFPKAAALVLAGAGLLTQAAHAQYSTGDLLLDLQSTTSGQDYIVDLSQSASAYAASTSAIVYQLSLSALNSALGSSWQTSANWFVIGSAPGGSPTLYASETESVLGTQNTQGLQRKSGSTHNSAQSKIDTIGGATAGQGTTAVVADGSASGWAPNASVLGGVLQRNTFTSGGLSSAVSDLSVDAFYNTASPKAFGAVKGWFTFGIDSLDSSLVDFTYNVPTVAAPEPMTYGLFAGAGLLALCLGQQFRRKVQA